MTQLTQTLLAARFECLGGACEDTCCQNWSMQVDDATLAKYRTAAPELLHAVDMESDGIPVMKRDAVTRHCIKMEDGLCSIHKKYGSDMLGDACHFYPRVTRALGSEKRMTLTPSCPEVMRLMLSLETPLATTTTDIARLPSVVKNYLPEGMAEPVARAVHDAFVAAALDEAVVPEQALARISSVARSMTMLDAATLDQSVPLYLRIADSRLPKPEEFAADAFNLLHALCGLIVASRKPISPRLAQTIADMEKALSCTLEWEQVQIRLLPQSADALTQVKEAWEPAQYAHTLRRYLALQLSLNLFPFAGLGNDAAQRITIIGVRYATVKLALACAHRLHGELPESEIVRIIQSLSRFMDHLGDASFSLSIYNETGWTKEARLLALFS